jgi:Na+-transporting methylmalonyl-CoA/oxaloacetate decarboxylase gamma subunit
MDNLGFGLQVTVLGLGMVFGLLVLMWLLLTLALRLEGRGAPAGSQRDQVVLRREAREGREGDLDLDPNLAAAIAVAVVRHADARRRQAAPAMRSYWPGSLLFASRWVSAGRTRQSQSWRRRPR